MSVTNGERLVTKQDLADMYQGILPYLGGMPEVLANKFSKGDMYSTDEKMIGQWTNGKPLYQKTYSTSVNIGSATTVDIPIITDFEYVDVIRCEVIRSSDSAHYILPNSGCNVIIMSSKNLRLNTASGVSYSGTLIFTIQYTKTTDTAISIGDDTDYSTEEKIIGTWIDGKPIYQKTFTGLNVSCVYNSWVTIVSAPANIDTLLFAFPLDIGNKVFPSIECRINSGNIQGDNTMASATRIVNVLTIQYTKTTD